MTKFLYNKKTLPDKGQHLCRLVSVKEVENRFFDPNGDAEDRSLQFEWVFAYEDKPETEIRVWSFRKLSTYRGQKSRALKIVEALLGKALGDEEKEVLETESLLESRCYLEVEHQTDDNGRIFAKVRDFQSERGIPF